LKTLFNLLRVKQWSKNLLIFAALIFTGNVFNPPLLLKTFLGFLLFCTTASGLYILNDLRDRNEDKIHPDKKSRPIASGKINSVVAMLISGLLLISSLPLSLLLGMNFFTILAIYAVMTMLYTLKLKHVVILDVFVLSSGFVLRAASGAYIINAPISPWFLICTTLGALFLALAKRRYEMVSIENASKHRKILLEYSVPLLDEMISVVTSSTVVAYSLYAFTSETASKHHYLMLTIPFVLYGIFRYLYLIHKKNMGGSPEMVLIKDKPLLINIVLYAAACILIVYLQK